MAGSAIAFQIKFNWDYGIAKQLLKYMGYKI
jgi:hypothetical protein